MKVQIIKGSNTFKVNSLYNQKVLKIIKTIKKRYYHRKNKTWHLPNEDFDIFIKSLTNIPEIEINCSDISQDSYHPHYKQHHYNTDKIKENLGPINNLEDVIGNIYNSV